MKVLPILTALFSVLCLTAGASASSYLVTVDQIGPNVVATGSGAIDLTGLAYQGSGGPAAAYINPGFAGSQFLIGAPASFDIYAPFNGPSFGFGNATGADEGMGDLVGFVLNVGQLYVPVGYASNTALSDSATYDNATFASLHVTPGVYVYTWGTGPDQSFTLEIGQTPIPGALPLFVSGLGALGLFSWRIKRRTHLSTSE